MLEKMRQQCSKYVLLVDLRYLDIRIIIDYLVYDPRSYTKNQQGGTRLSRIVIPHNLGTDKTYWGGGGGGGLLNNTNHNSFTISYTYS